jgi:multidrug resistance efflux pump
VAASETSKSLSDRVQSLRLPVGNQPSSDSRLPWGLCVILAIAVGYLLVMGSPFQSERSSLTVADPVVGTPTANASTITPSAAAPSPGSPGGVALESKGYIIPEQQILVSPQVSGRVIELNFDAGQPVEKNFVLAVLDNTEYMAEYDRILATLDSAKHNMAELDEGNRPDEKAQAKAELAEAQTNFIQSERDYLRKKDLMDRKIVSKEEFETAESQFKALAKRVEKLAASSRLMDEGARAERKRMAKSQVQQIEAELRRAKWRLDNCVITAPISGTILKKNAELGNLVNPVAFNGSYSLCDMADLSKLEVELSIQERDIAQVFKGQKCKVRPEAYPKRVYDGIVSRLMPIADRAKGALPVRVRLTVPADEEGIYLKPEMGATVQFYARPEAEDIGLRQRGGAQELLEQSERDSQSSSMSRAKPAGTDEPQKSK